MVNWQCFNYVFFLLICKSRAHHVEIICHAQIARQLQLHYGAAIRMVILFVMHADYTTNCIMSVDQCP